MMGVIYSHKKQKSSRLSIFFAVFLYFFTFYRDIRFLCDICHIG